MKVDEIDTYLYNLKKDKPNLAALDDELIKELFNIKVNGEFTLCAVLLFSLYPQAYFPKSCRKDSVDTNNIEKSVLEFCEIPRTRDEIGEFVGLKSVSYAIKKYVVPLVKEEKIELEFPEKPKSSKQKYHRKK